MTRTKPDVPSPDPSLPTPSGLVVVDKPAGWTSHDVVARAMTRPPRTRFDPIACVDSDGRYVGLVHVEHLVTATITAG